jgi:hypothetical protein
MRVVAACVAENRPDFARKVENLLLSWRAFGGAAEGIQFVVHVVDVVDHDSARRYEQLGAEVRVVPRLPLDNFALANKLRMLELAEETDFDVLLALDCDVVMTGDPTPYVDDKRIGAAPADRDPLTVREWRRLFASLGLPPLPRTLAATTSGRPLPPYYNSGVLSVPRAECVPLMRAWRAALDRIMEMWKSPHPPLAPPLQFYSEQWALMVALVDRDVRVMPSTMNLPTHVRIRSGLELTGEPIILHYHSRLSSDGFLLEPMNPYAREATDRFNRVRASEFPHLSYQGLRSDGRLQHEFTLLRRRVHHRVRSLLWYAQRAAPLPARKSRG